MKAANDERPQEPTVGEIWTFVAAGCNANELAAYLGITVVAASAMIHHATRYHALAA